MALEQAEAVAEPVADVDDAHAGHPRRGELDAQREPVEHATDLEHRRHGGRMIVEREVRTDAPRPLGEEGHGR